MKNQTTAPSLSPGALDARRDNSPTLLVLLHHINFGGSAERSLADVRAAVEEIYDQPDIYAPRLPANPLSFQDPTALAWQIVGEIDERWHARQAAGNPWERIVLIGHSYGGLIARTVYLLACGEAPANPDHQRRRPAWILQLPDGHRRNPFSQPAPPQVKPRAWAHTVDRVLLFAAMNRGWTIDARVQGIWVALAFHLLHWVAQSWQLLANLCRGWPWRRWRPLLGTVLQRGAVFVSELRWQWLEMTREPFDGPDGHSPLGQAPVIQFLGSRDDLVSPEDNIDLVAGAKFYYLEMPDSGHVDVVSLQLRPAGEGPELPPFRPTDDPVLLRKRRGDKLKQALLTPASELKSDMPVDSVGPGRPPADAAKYQGVIFVIHGIRDEGFWTKKIAWRVQQLAGSAKPFAAVTDSYGYFPMLPFLLPWERHKKVAWLVDRYVEACAAYPNAKFHYVGHSNGTYLLARALLDYPFLKFEHVVFAGSVVPTLYPWDRLLRENRVRGVLNYVATQDWVVAFFPKFFQFPEFVTRRFPKGWNWTGLQDLGSGGHDGFRDLVFQATETAVPFTAERGQQIQFAQGAHAAALVEANWHTIAESIVNGTPHGAPPVCVQHRGGLGKFFAAVSVVPVVVWGSIVTLLYLIFCAILKAWPGQAIAGLQRLCLGLSALDWTAFAQLLLLLAYYRVIKFALTRF